jgi:hypothetical protein
MVIRRIGSEIRGDRVGSISETRTGTEKSKCKGKGEEMSREGWREKRVGAW